jgi:hypothetical protein
MLVLLALLLNGWPQEVPAKTAIEFLWEAPKPQFCQGHTLLPLTRWGWTMPDDVRLELAEHWGYAIEFGAATERAAAQLEDPASTVSKLSALTASDPKRYPLCVLTRRPLLEKEFRAGLPEDAWCHDADGKLIEAPKRFLSPEAPDAIFVKAGALMAEPLRKICAKAPIAVALNGGEYGLGVFGFAGKGWASDPKVVKAKGHSDWYEYLSRRKAHHEMLIRQAFEQAVPDCKLYLYYPTSACPHRNRSADWWQWHYGYEWMRPVSDLPNISIYYREFNSGWIGNNDMLTQALNAIGRQIELGQPLSYNWLCSGWPQKNIPLDEAFSDSEHYMGFLKCYYTAGMLGGVAGYFAFPPGGFGKDLGTEAPSWLQQQMVLGHAQALFSHLEEYIRGGVLLPGPQKHRWSKEQPAYEYPTGDPQARVLVRRHPQRNEWLITAWAAGGEDRQVSVTVGKIGAVSLQARTCGTVYLAKIEAGKTVLKLIDSDGMLPSAGMR